MPKKKTPEPKPKAKPVAAPDFDAQVCKALRKAWQSSGEIAIKLGLCTTDADGEKHATKYGAAKVRESCKRLTDAGKAKHTGSFKDSRYAKA